MEIDRFYKWKDWEVQLAEPSGNETYTLQFKEDGFIDGVTSIQTEHMESMSWLKIQEAKLHNPIGAITMINELYDGNRYIEAMRSVDNYRINY